jgi:hypothetical protein
VKPHVDATAAEGHSFRLQPEPLLKCVLATQLDFSASAQNPVPGKSRRLMQCAHHLSRCARKSGGFGDGSVRGHLSARYFANSSNDALVHFDFLIDAA